ncbi:30S ribosomal protein S7 [candidate division WWE3 bacterium RIFCSPHIGHO2_01_FULL_40_23]|uniref:Small ribosomal subunit protein uS7 n=1 Tax=candidate division WWE3 bacterium RIFCSPLOWO2_01_FULL_41_18 TaxID=1802625 RepID=A0A1F4VDF0_UNCKA|nr:MAG: 30S ribosomal protein S7 [candidate division WWE3 bacterium RIFCSPHIGHO2_01_FULL_40_23]OGC55179.1 MAG: 30S ribosomal protein S7 [candidate division WWE3 bacterium RIFCSPLOWO2_01_FULL_41_18]
MRGLKVKKRQAQPDAVYKSKVVGRFVNNLMVHGKKSLSENIIYTSLSNLNLDKKEAVSIFEQAVKNVMPRQEVRSRRVGGATYQIPFPVRHDRSEALAMRWIIQAARSKKGKPMWEKLVSEIKDANSNTGAAIKKRDDVHRMAEANKAFSHFRF